MVDNDCDGLVDCDDPDCPQPCPPIRKDPSTLRFRQGHLGRFKSHGRIAPPASIDLASTDIGCVLSDARGLIWSGVLHPGDMTSNTTGTRFKFRDPAALYGQGTRDGIFEVVIRLNKRDMSYAYSITAYADFSAADNPALTIQFYVGEPLQPYHHTAPWTPTPWGWKSSE